TDPVTSSSLSAGGNQAAMPKEAYSKLSSVDKAGIKVDTSHVANIVDRATAGSKFAEHEAQRRVLGEQKVRKMKQRLEELKVEDAASSFLTAARLASVEARVTRLVQELSSSRDLSRTFVWLDMDAFFCACELTLDPSLAGKPFAVGGRMMLSTANYEA